MASSSDRGQQHGPHNPEYDEPFTAQELGVPVVLDTASDGDSNSTYSAESLRDSIFNYIVENGRTYHRYHEGTYYLPNDSTEIDRLDLQYIILKLVMGGKDHFAPLQNPRNMLDIGAGTGIWCTEMAKQWPNAIIEGQDISFIQHPEHPDNVRWFIGDAVGDPWGSKKYDYVHTRMMLGAFPDFKVIIRKAYENLTPGGWFESQELWPRACCADGTMPEDWKFIEWAANQDQAAMNANQPLRIANKLARWYKEAGFVDVEQHICRIPIGGYLNEAQPRMIGKFWLRQLIEGLPAFTMAYFTRHLGWSPDQVEVYLVEVRKALKDLESHPRIHAFHQFYIVWGRKPTLQELAASKSASPSTPADASSPSAGPRAARASSAL